MLEKSNATVRPYFTMKNRIILYFITFTFLIAFYSCINQKNNSFEAVETPVVPKKAESDWKKYLPVKQLVVYRNQAPTVSIVKNSTEPFSTLIYNKVIAYDYEGNEEAYNSVIKNGNFIPVVIKQQSLNQKQVEKVIQLLTDKTTYGETTAACFNPHLAFVFYKDNDIVFKTDICLSCNYQTPSINIPAMNHKKIQLENGDFYYAKGFTYSGKQRIKSLCKELNFLYGK